MNDTCEHCGAVLQDQELPLNLPPGRDRFCNVSCAAAFSADVPEPAPEHEHPELDLLP